MADDTNDTRRYPLPRPADDARFTTGLLIDVVDVLVRHGYPRPEAAKDLTDLQQALFRFLYDPANR
jgi:hypothetical protein